MVYNLDSRPLNQWPADLLRKKAAAMAEAAGVDLTEIWEEEYRETTGKSLDNPQLRRDQLAEFIEDILVDVYDCSLSVKIEEELPPPEPPKPEDPAEIRKERDSLRQEIQGVKQQLNELTEKNTKLAASVQQLEQEKSDAATAADEKLKKLTEENTKLTASVQQLEQEKSDAATAADEKLKKLTEENTKLTASVQQLEQEKNTMAPSASAAAACLFGIGVPLKNTAPRGIGSHDSGLEEENAHLKKRVQQLEQEKNSAALAASSRLRALSAEKVQLENKVRQLEQKLQQQEFNAARKPLAGSLWDTPAPTANQAPKPRPAQKTGPMISDLFKTPPSNN